MTLAARATAPPPRTGNPCSIRVLLDTLDASESAALATMLEHPDWSANAIHTAITAEGHTAGYQTIGRHRRRECRCYMEATK